MRVIIAEKPSLGKAIDAWLKTKAKTDITYSQYQVTWLFGHMLELDEPEGYDAKYKSWNINLLPIKPAKFKLHIKDNDGVKRQVNAIQQMLQNAVEIVNAGDPDREGQLLVDELLEYFDNKKPVKRLWLSAIDDKSIERAFISIKDNSEYVGYKLAAETRSRADWLVGMNYSRAMSHVFKVHGYDSVSVGRVQTPTLKLIVDRDNEIKNFVSKDFFELLGVFADNTASLSARLVLPDAIKALLDDENRLLDKQPLVEISNAITNKIGKVESYTKQSKTKKQPLLFNLSELQAVVNRKLGYSAQEVLDIAQTLYENKLTSYPRSDCQYMPLSQHSDGAEILQALTKLPQYAKLSPTATIKSSVWNDSKVTAHHAIVPTGANMSALEQLGEKERRVFHLIALQYLMQFYPELRYDEVEILINIVRYQFRAVGKTITDLGWKSLITTSDDDEDKDDEEKQLLPKLAKGQELKCVSADIVTKKTQKPKPYTEGTLIKAMENIHNKITDLVKAENYDPETTAKLIKDYRASLKETAGLGTEATRASIIETLKRREFIQVSKKAINATEFGGLLIHSLVNDPIIKNELGFLASPLTTARYEQYLDAIQNKSGQPEILLGNLTIQLDKLINFANLKFNLPFQANIQKCAKCNAGALIKLKGKFSDYFWKCPSCNTNFSDSNGTPYFTESKAEAVAIGKKCPDCGSELVERMGKFGKFTACSGYPQCKWMPPKADKPQAATTDKKCPTCKTGMLVVRNSAKGEFLGCNKFPKCKHMEQING